MVCLNHPAAHTGIRNSAAALPQCQCWIRKRNYNKELSFSKRRVVFPCIARHSNIKYTRNTTKMMANLRLTWKKAYHTAPHASNRTARGSYAGHKHSTSQKNTQNYGYAHHFRKVFLETLVIKPTQSRPPFPCSRKSQTSPCSAVFCFPCTNASCSALRPATARASNAMEGLTRNKTLLFLKK